VIPGFASKENARGAVYCIGGGLCREIDGRPTIEGGLRSLMINKSYAVEKRSKSFRLSGSK
jgi:hypothetical protein